MTEQINWFRDLRVWREAMDLLEACNTVPATPARDEAYGLTAHFAEEYGRESNGVNVQFLEIAQGSVKEIDTLIPVGEGVGVAGDVETRAPLARCEPVCTILNGLFPCPQRETG